METLQYLLGSGIDPKDLNSIQVTARGIVMFLGAVVLIRIGDRRFLTRKTAFDAVMGFILASMFARAVNGSAALVPTLAGGFAIVLLHRGLAVLSSRNHFLGNLIKGRPEKLIQNGVLLKEKLKSNGLSEGDLLEDLRLNGKLSDLSEVETAYFERNGDISMIPRK